MNITVGTCCTPHGWACWGRWGCPKVSWSPWYNFKSFCLRKVVYEHAPCQFSMNIACICFTCHGWSCRVGWGCTRASWSPLDRFKSIHLRKHAPCQLLMNKTGTCCTSHGWVCRGRWGFPRALSPLDQYRSFYFQIPIFHLHEPYAHWLFLACTWRLTLRAS